MSLRSQNIVNTRTHQSRGMLPGDHSERCRRFQAFVDKTSIVSIIFSVLPKAFVNDFFQASQFGSNDWTSERLRLLFQELCNLVGSPGSDLGCLGVSEFYILAPTSQRTSCKIFCFDGSLCVSAGFLTRHSTVGAAYLAVFLAALWPAVRSLRCGHFLVQCSAFSQTEHHCLHESY